MQWNERNSTKKRWNQVKILEDHRGFTQPRNNQYHRVRQRKIPSCKRFQEFRSRRPRGTRSADSQPADYSYRDWTGHRSINRRWCGVDHRTLITGLCNRLARGRNTPAGWFTFQRVRIGVNAALESATAQIDFSIKSRPAKLHETESSAPVVRPFVRPIDRNWRDCPRGFWPLEFPWGRAPRGFRAVEGVVPLVCKRQTVLRLIGVFLRCSGNCR